MQDSHLKQMLIVIWGDINNFNFFPLNEQPIHNVEKNVHPFTFKLPLQAAYYLCDTFANWAINALWCEENILVEHAMCRSAFEVYTETRKVKSSDGNIKPGRCFFLHLPDKAKT